MALARGARLIFAAHVGRMMCNRVFGLHVGLRSGIFAGAILVAVGVTPVHAQSGDPISPPANTVGPADSTPSPDHVRKPTEPPPFDSNRPAARAARVKATPPAAPAPGSDAAQPKAPTRIGTVGGAANGRIDAARDIAPARGSDHAIRRGRATSTARDDGRSVGGAGDGASSRIAPDGAPALRSIRRTPAGRATSTARDDGRSVGGAGDAPAPASRPTARQRSIDPSAEPRRRQLPNRARRRGGARSRPR